MQEEEPIYQAGNDPKQLRREIEIAQSNASYWHEKATAESPKKEEPVRTAAGVALLAAALIIICEKLGWASLTVEEATTILAAVTFLANEAARMHVWAKPKA